jgi:hypothetical protein
VFPTPSGIGATAERELAFALERAGWQVYLPMFAAHARIDLIAVLHGRAVRIQVKTARRAGEALVFRTCSNTANVPRDYRGEIDAFGVFAPHSGRTYLVPVEQTGLRTCSLRLTAARSGQTKGIRLAADYELERLWSDVPRLTGEETA